MDRQPRFQLAHERLDCYRLAVSVARWAWAQRFPAARKHLQDQLLRASDSVVQNIAEGMGHPTGPSRRNFLRIAMGSAAEVAAVLDLVDLPGGPDRQEELRRVTVMLMGLSRG